MPLCSAGKKVKKMALERLALPPIPSGNSSTSSFEGGVRGSSGIGIKQSGKKLKSLSTRQVQDWEQAGIVSLDLSRNHFENFPLTDSIDTLAKLDLSAQTIPSKSFIGRRPALANLPHNIHELFPELRELNLGFNSISALPKSFAKLSRLSVLDLRSNQIKEFPQCILSLKSLTTLILSDNLLKGIPSLIGTMTNLKVLRLANNKLTSLPDCIYLLNNLNTLSLRHNKLKSLPANLYALHGLYLQFPPTPLVDDSGETTGLTVEGNPLKYPPPDICEQGVRKMFEYMESHPPSGSGVVLNVSGKELKALPSTTKKDARHVTILKAEDNAIDRLPKQFSAQHPNVSILLLARNKFNEFPAGLFNLPLVALSLRDQQPKRCLSSVPHTLGLLKNLQELDLSENGIEKVPEEIKSLSCLKALNLEDNKLSTLPNAICDLSNLECLSLGKNNLKKLPESIGNLTQLQILRLSENRLTSLPMSVCRLTRLAVLTLRSNNLVYLPHDMDNMVGLSNLDKPFSYKTIHTTFFGRKLKLSDNPNLMFPPLPERHSVFQYLSQMRYDPATRGPILERAKKRERELLESPGSPIPPTTLPKSAGDFKVLTQQLRYDLAKNLSKERQVLGRLLFLKPHIIDTVEQDHFRDGVVVQTFKLLEMWIRERPAVAEEDLVQQMEETLCQLGRNDLAHMVESARTKAGMV